MHFLTKGLIAAVLTECSFATCLYFGEAIDVDRGDLLGLVGWLSHRPFAMVLTHGLYLDIYSDVLSWPLFLTAFLFWSPSWSLFFFVLPRLRPPRFQSRNAIEHPRSA